MKIEFYTVPDCHLPVLTLQSVAALHGIGALFIDVRSVAEVASGTLPNSLHIPVNSIPHAVTSLKHYQQSPVVLFCKSGIRSDTAAQILRQHGFLQAWNGGGYADLLSVINQD